MKSAALLEEVYPTHTRHPGVLHYMIHSYDDPIHAPLGLRAARRYGAVEPDAPHALHMTSHIFIALGMWDEVIVANQNAWRMGNALNASRGRPPGVCGHGITWLTYGYLQEGRDAERRRSSPVAASPRRPRWPTRAPLDPIPTAAPSAHTSSCA